MDRWRSIQLRSCIKNPYRAVRKNSETFYVEKESGVCLLSFAANKHLGLKWRVLIGDYGICLLRMLIFIRSSGSFAGGDATDTVINLNAWYAWGQNKALILTSFVWCSNIFADDEVMKKCQLSDAFTRNKISQDRNFECVLLSMFCLNL